MKFSTAPRLPAILNARPTGESRWVARCPAHDDRSPSLSVRRAVDGRWLIHCLAGCRAEDVLTALGLDWQDLFPDRPRYHVGRPRPRRDDPAKQRLRELREWRSRVASVIRDSVHDRHQVATLGERLWVDGRHEQAWSCLEYAYVGIARDEWLLELLESRDAAAWRTAKAFLEGGR